MTDFIVRRVIRSSGVIEVLDGPKKEWELRKAIDTNLASKIKFPNGMMMIMDDMAAIRKLPVNALATMIYQNQLKPLNTCHVFGDVVLIPQSDY
jgi:hypothetical protein